MSQTPPTRDEYDREVCLCFHIQLGKIAKFCRLENPRFASEISRCYGAGSGCGWCIPFLEKIFEQSRRGEEPSFGMTAEEYRERRRLYRLTGSREATAPPPTADRPAGAPSKSQDSTADRKTDET